MDLPATIETSVSKEVITKVTRLFNGTIQDVLNSFRMRGVPAPRASQSIPST
jgi:hypothetical protein